MCIRDSVEDGVEHGADVDIARPTTALGWRDHRRKLSPLRVSQITWITKAAPVGVSPMFRLPHGRILRIKPHAMESHPIHPTQQVFGSALRLAQKPSAFRSYRPHPPATENPPRRSAPRVFW